MDHQLTRHMVHVYRYALRLTGARTHAAEDITQETMLRAVRGLHTLKRPANMRAWLLQITTNVWRDTCRKNARNRDGGCSSNAEDCVANDMDPAELTLLREDVSLSLAALDRLPDRQRSVLYLAACEQLPLSEIAEVLAISPPAVKASLSVARAKMRRVLQVKDRVREDLGVSSDASEL